MARRPPGPGRPSKGDRDAFLTRPARPLGDRIRAEADVADMPYGEYIAAVLARALGMPDTAPKPGPNAAEHALELPLNEVEAPTRRSA